MMLKAGDTILFGQYRQDTVDSLTPIQWTVLAVNNGKALLLSRFVVDAKPYHDQYKKTAWESCMLREWLNTVFYDIAFSSDEKKKICLTELSNNDSEHGTLGKSKATKDYVFLLSSDEFIRYQDVLYDKYVEMIGIPTDFALNQGVMAKPVQVTDDMGILRSGVNYVCDRWWLRNRIKEADFAACVLNGKLSEFPVFFDERVLPGVRPAVVIDMPAYNK